MGINDEKFVLGLGNLLNGKTYDKRLLNEMLTMIKEYFGADACSYNLPEFTEEISTADQFEQLPFINIEGIHIYNPRVEITNFIREFIAIYFKTFMNLYILHKKSYIDNLTGVCNYNALSETLNKKAEYHNVGVAFIDVNGLKVINDTLGHKEGDKMLTIIATLLNSVFRKSDIYRKGGDEFVILCTDVAEDIFVEKIHQVKALLKTTEYSASFGIAYSESVEDITSLIAQADARMYAEKEEYRLHHPERYKIKNFS